MTTQSNSQSDFSQAIEMKLATRRAYDAAKATVEALEAHLAVFPGLAAQIRPVLDQAQASLAAAVDADVLAYEQLPGS